MSFFNTLRFMPWVLWDSRVAARDTERAAKELAAYARKSGLVITSPENRNRYRDEMMRGASTIVMGPKQFEQYQKAMQAPPPKPRGNRKQRRRAAARRD